MVGIGVRKGNKGGDVGVGDGGGDGPGSGGGIGDERETTSAAISSQV